MSTPGVTRVLHDLRLRLLEVVGVARVTPHLVRVTLGSEDLRDFVSPGFDDHVKEHLACRTWIEGDFTAEFTMSPAGVLPPNGRHVVFALSNIFRFDGDGRFVEEWVEYDYVSLMEQLRGDGLDRLR